MKCWKSLPAPIYPVYTLNTSSMLNRLHYFSFVSSIITCIHWTIPQRSTHWTCICSIYMELWAIPRTAMFHRCENMNGYWMATYMYIQLAFILMFSPPPTRSHYSAWQLHLVCTTTEKHPTALLSLFFQFLVNSIYTVYNISISCLAINTHEYT